VGGATHEELVDAHAGVDGDLASEVALELLLLHRLGRVVRQQLRQTLQQNIPGARARTEARTRQSIRHETATAGKST
jgi:ribosomal protein S13